MLSSFEKFSSVKSLRRGPQGNREMGTSSLKWGGWQGGGWQWGGSPSLPAFPASFIDCEETLTHIGCSSGPALCPTIWFFIQTMKVSTCYSKILSSQSTAVFCPRTAKKIVYGPSWGPQCPICNCGMYKGSRPHSGQRNNWLGDQGGLHTGSESGMETAIGEREQNIPQVKTQPGQTT